MPFEVFDDSAEAEFGLGGFGENGCAKFAELVQSFGEVGNGEAEASGGGVFGGCGGWIDFENGLAESRAEVFGAIAVTVLCESQAQCGLEGGEFIDVVCADDD